MSEGVIVALITLCGSGIGSSCGILISNKLTILGLSSITK